MLSGIEAVKGKTDPKLIRMSDEYAKDILGAQAYAPWLYVYSAVADEFREGWMPDNYYGKVVIPAIQGRYMQLDTLPAATNQLFQSNAFPDLAYFVNGVFRSKNLAVLGEDELRETLFAGRDRVVFKLEESLQGLGVFFFDRDSFSISKVQAFGNGFFQEYIDQHQFFGDLEPNSVATLRVTTVFDGTGISMRAFHLRLGRSEDTHVKAVSQIVIPVDRATGELGIVGYLPSWNTITEHPDTKVSFSNRVIPCFESCVALAQELHESIPYVGAVGWDMVVDSSNTIKVMEWNARHNGIKLAEAAQGPCFADLGWEKLWR